MPRPRRRDQIGDWFHVMNRATARRTLIENRSDVEFLLKRIGDASAKGEIEVHAFVLMTTHFHLLVRSPSGQLSSALHRISSGYAHYFNRTRDRDGPLLRNRFVSKLIDSDLYWRVTIAYLDANPCQAGIVAHPGDYPHGSCRAYLQGNGPDWLHRDRVRAEACALTGIRPFSPRAYSAAYHRRFTDVHLRIVEGQLRACTPLGLSESLLRGAPDAVLDWLHERSELADGTRPGAPVVPPEIIERAAAVTPPLGKRGLRLLLRELAGQTFAEIGRRTGCSAECARLAVRRAQRSMAECDSLRSGLARVASEALALAYGAWA